MKHHREGERFARIPPTNGTSKHGNHSIESPSHHREMELFEERFLDLQERQMDMFNEMLNRHEHFLMRLLQQQREAAEEQQQRDRNFVCKMVDAFLKDKKS